MTNDRIEINPAVMLGKPVIRGTRIPVEHILRKLSEGATEADLLDAYFVGQAKEKLADTIREQRNLGIQTSYQPTSHNIKVVFYSPEGLSIQLLDEVEYDVDVRNGDHSMGSQHVRARYVAVLTPTESRWKVRVFQGGTP